MKNILVFLGCKKSEFTFTIYENKVHEGDLSIGQYLKAVKTRGNFMPQRDSINLKTFIKSKSLPYPPLKKTTKLFLLELYNDDIRELEIFLNKDLSIWFN